MAATKLPKEPRGHLDLILAFSPLSQGDLIPGHIPSPFNQFIYSCPSWQFEDVLRQNVLSPKKKKKTLFEFSETLKSVVGRMI